MWEGEGLKSGEEDNQNKQSEDANSQEALTWKQKVWAVFEDPSGSTAGTVITVVMLTVIIYSTTVYVLQSVKSISDFDYRFWQTSDAVCAVIFTVEYLVRLVTCPSKKFAKWDYLIKPMNIVDVVAFLPFYVQLIADGGLATSQADFNSTGQKGVFRIVRVLRLVRVMRVVKAGNYSGHLSIFIKTYQNSAAALGSLLVLVLLSAVFFASVMYELERNEQPEKFFSIPNSIYWCIVTIGTVGYGDIFPVTPLGKLLTSVTMIIGLLSVALPVTLIGSESVRQYDEFVEQKRLQALRKGKQTNLLSIKDVAGGQMSSVMELKSLGKPKITLLWGGKRRTLFWLLLEGPAKDDTTSQLLYPKIVFASQQLSLFLCAVIGLSVLSIIIASIPSMQSVDGSVWDNIEALCISVFTTEYALRWILVPETNKDGTSFLLAPLGKVGVFIGTRLRFMRAPMSIVDLLAILPYYATLGQASSGGPWAALRVLRLARLLRVFKLGQHSVTINILFQSLQMASPALGMMFVFVAVYLLLFGSLIYECEKDAPDTLYTSIPASFWWGIATVTTVGYGDMYPTTTCGKVITCCAVLVGSVGITLPLAIAGVFYAELTSHHTQVASQEASAAALQKLSPEDLRKSLDKELEDLALRLGDKYPGFSVTSAVEDKQENAATKTAAL